MKWLVGITLLLFVGAGAAGLCLFWSDRSQRPTAFFSFLQFGATLALLFLTFLYVKATQEQLVDQNRAPKFQVTYHSYPQATPFVVNFEILIANPSVRATSVSVKSVRIGQNQAMSACFTGMQLRTLIPARDLVKATVEATFESIPISLHEKRKAVLVFEEIFHGTLPEIEYIV
jgi:hypothetical protein